MKEATCQTLSQRGGIHLNTFGHLIKKRIVLVPLKLFKDKINIIIMLSIKTDSPAEFFFYYYYLKMKSLQTLGRASVKPDFCFCVCKADTNHTHTLV